MGDLAGRRVVVTRPLAQSASMCRALELQHAHPILFPTVQIAPFEDNADLVRVFSEWDSFDWVVFTSVNGVRILFDSAAAVGLTLRQQAGHPNFAAIGPATARELETRGGTVQCVPKEYVAEAVVKALGEVAGQRILLPRAKKARRVLSDQLAARGAEVVEVATYDVVEPTPAPDVDDLLAAEADVITFTSSSTVDGWLHLLGEHARSVLDKSCVACIGPITADTARRADIRVDVVAKDYTTDGLISALVEHFAS